MNHCLNKEYLFQDGVNYSKEEVVEKIVKMCNFFKSKKMRFDVTMWTNPNQYSHMYLLNDEQIRTYVKYFEDKHFDNESANKIVQCMGAVYHVLDISLDEALDFADYVSENRLTLTKAIKDKFDVNFDEITLFLDEVMAKNAEFCIKQALKYGKKFCEDLETLFKK